MTHSNPYQLEIEFPSITLCDCGCGQPVNSANSKEWLPTRITLHHSRRRRSLEERFWEKVDKHGPNECWLWLACAGIGGYGKIGTGHGKNIADAHRVSWELHYGNVPDDLCVLHTCDVKTCVNPNHLFLGTNQDNTDDMVNKGRSGHGSKNTQAKLTEADVRTIRNLAAKGIDAQAIAKRFDVSIGNVHLIIKRKTWRHI